MKAAQIRDYGDASAVSVERNAPAPASGPGRVLVKVHAASLNPVDSAVRSGVFRQMVPLQFPVTLGTDFSGVVTEVGAGVGHVRVGDRVLGMASVLVGGSGTFAELVSAMGAMVAKIPDGLGFVEASALPLAGVSALQALEAMNVVAGTRILIHGGSGGVGAFAIQIARALGAHVAATVRGDAASVAKKLGADEVINFEKTKFETLVSDYDAVLDNVGGDTLKASLHVLRKGGSLVSLAGKPDAEHASSHGITAALQMTQVTTERLEKLLRLVSEGKVKASVHRTFPLNDVRQAFAEREKGGTRGKVVLLIA